MYLINKTYLYLYKILPYRIEADDEKMVCTDFLFSKRHVTVFFKDITTLTGGIFDKMKDARQLETLILSKVSKELYDEVVERVGLNNKRKSIKKDK